MTPLPPEPSKEPTSAETQSSNSLKFSKMQVALAFVIAGISDAIGAFLTPLPPIGWVTDGATVLLPFLVGPAVVAVAGTSSGGHSGLGHTSILAAGGRSDCCFGYASTEV